MDKMKYRLLICCEVKSMITLLVMDMKYYDISMPRFFREAVRAIIFTNGEIVLGKRETKNEDFW